MGRIQSSIGLITGIPIAETVDQLMQIAARPKQLLSARNQTLRAEQLAVTELSGLLLSIKFATEKLAGETYYEKRDVTSSNPTALSATVSGQPPTGSYQFTPLRTVQTQQLLSSGLKSQTDSLGGGTLTFRFGDHVERTTGLDRLGGGQGFARGRIRITDRSGAIAEIDLSTALDIDDVLQAINASTGVDVTATTWGDCIRLVDHTGQTSSNLKVEEVGGGATAASLGLASIDVAADVADGDDVLYLTEAFDLEALNDGSGVSADPILADIRYELRDGTTGTIDLSPIVPGSSSVDKETTLGEVLERINAAEPGKLQVEIAPDGERLVITDLTTGGGQFALESLNQSAALTDLGLDGDSSSGQLSGRRILGGLRTVLLSSLEGGQGFGALGLLQLTDRSGATDSVDLSGAETLEDVLEQINSASVGIAAEVNDARNGIKLVDTTGASASNLIVANGDATGTADKLHLAVDADTTSVASGDMHLRIVSRTTRLADWNGGAGVSRGLIRFVDSEHGQDELNLKDDDIQSVGDLIRAINRLDVKVVAELNETGDGIRIRDLGEGSGTLAVSDVDSTAAADLYIAGEAVEMEVGGNRVQAIDGATTHTIQLGSDDTLVDLRDKINERGAGPAASILVDGSSSPYRLSLLSGRPGRLGELVVDTSEIELSFGAAVEGQDSLLVFGDARTPGSTVLLCSASNTFANVLSDVTLQMHEASDKPVTITVSKTDEDLVAGVEDLVNRYNKFRAKLMESTRYDPETNTASILTGDAAALRLDNDLGYLLSGRFVGAGTIRSVAEVGIEIESDGMLRFDRSRFQEQYQSDPQAVREFFTHEEFGFSARFGKLIGQLAEEDASLLGQRTRSLDAKIRQNEERIAFMTQRLDVQRERLLLDFYRLENAIGKLQSSLDALESIQALPPLTSVSKAR
jgi:flagellar hook-associated protein 2